ncbi:MAG: hypothetical protein EB060_12275 [Proteobacteria bacterium]|nr:hypothetical protein [Pseudomonadota bacterium]
MESFTDESEYATSLLPTLKVQYGKNDNDVEDVTPTGYKFVHDIFVHYRGKVEEAVNDPERPGETTQRMKPIPAEFQQQLIDDARTRGGRNLSKLADIIRQYRSDEVYENYVNDMRRLSTFRSNVVGVYTAAVSAIQVANIGIDKY